MQPPDSTPGEATAQRIPNDGGDGLSRTLVWIGVGLSVAGLGAAVAYSIVRAVVGARRLPDDPTSLRIQHLIDEANSLLKTLDDQKHSA
ncbi:MAG: hypothetical protein WB615_15685 [Candidatus Tumulicola sp.]